MINEIETEEIAEKILSKLKDNIKKDIADSFYTEMQNYLYEHYTNNKEKITEEIIKEITEDFQSDPTKYKYFKLRKKLFSENKDKIILGITEDAVEEILLYHSFHDYEGSWRWKDSIVKLVLENWDKFKDDPRIQEGFGRKLEMLQNWIEQLEEKLKNKDNQNE